MTPEFKDKAHKYSFNISALGAAILFCASTIMQNDFDSFYEKMHQDPEKDCRAMYQTDYDIRHKGMIFDLRSKPSEEGFDDQESYTRDCVNKIENMPDTVPQIETTSDYSKVLAIMSLLICANWLRLRQKYPHLGNKSGPDDPST
tara:strand:+ start:647 stop:1081 length:435 start_codon:yes stop_codon:yes gene_type:complete